jgi:hypothetical protein
MISPAEFWGSVRPSGMTAEAELVELWTRLRDCNRQGGGGRPHRPHRRSRAGRDDDFDHDKPRRMRQAAAEAARRARVDAEAREAEQARLRALLAAPGATENVTPGEPATVAVPEVALLAENGPETAVLEGISTLSTIAEAVQEIAERRRRDNRRRALILAALLALDE